MSATARWQTSKSKIDLMAVKIKAGKFSRFPLARKQFEDFDRLRKWHGNASPSPLSIAAVMLKSSFHMGICRPTLNHHRWTTAAPQIEIEPVIPERLGEEQFPLRSRWPLPMSVEEVRAEASTQADKMVGNRSPQLAIKNMPSKFEAVLSTWL